MADPFNLQRFVNAQAPVYRTVLDELRVGCKESHWMWFVFPQHHELGQSSMAKRYGITSLAQAQAYMAHPILGPRLVECCELLLAVKGKSAFDILGTPDDMKLKSCVTLFRAAQNAVPVWDRVLQRFYGGQPDRATLEILQRQNQ